MKVRELMEILSQLPQDVEVEVNDNNGGEVYAIDSIDHFKKGRDPALVIIQVNCD